MWDSDSKWANPWSQITPDGQTASVSATGRIWGVCGSTSFSGRSFYRWVVRTWADVCDSTFFGLVYRDKATPPNWSGERDFSRQSTFYLTLNSSGSTWISNLGTGDTFIREMASFVLNRYRHENKREIRASFELCLLSTQLRIWINGCHIGNFQPPDTNGNLKGAAPMASVERLNTNPQKITIIPVQTFDLADTTAQNNLQ